MRLSTALGPGGPRREPTVTLHNKRYKGTRVQYPRERHHYCVMDVVDDYSVLGWTWLGLHHLGYDEEEAKLEAVEGFDIWKLYVAPRLRVGPMEYKSAAYTSFKNALKELDTIGAIERCGPAGERKLARILWLPTDKGQEWWDEKGLNLHGPERQKDARTGIAVTPPMKKWQDLSGVNGPTRRLIERMVFSGQWECAFRPVEENRR